MDKEKLDADVLKAESILPLKRKITGVKFLFNKEEYDQAEAQTINGKRSYCVMVKTAMSGVKLKAKLENFGCMGGARALGMVELDEYYSSGRMFNDLGLYKDLGTAKNINNNMTSCKHKAYGILVSPLSEFNMLPDVVIIVGDSYLAMRIIQGYSYEYGTNTAFKMIGNQAICSECTAYPHEKQDINISVLCSGTRYKAGWSDAELAIGMPYNLFGGVINGVFETINPMEADSYKSSIAKKIKANGINNKEIVLGRNYFTGLYQEDKKRFEL